VAHKIRIVRKPLLNKDGKPSKRNATYDVVDKTRGRTIVVMEGLPSEAAAKEWARDYRTITLEDHYEKHPNDQAFINKHTPKLIGEDK